MYLYEGLKLQGRCTKNGIYNGIIYTMVKLNKKTMTVRDKTEFEVSYEFAKEAFRLCHARTIFSAQSQTLEGSLCIHDMDNRVAGSKHLLTAVSRGKRRDLIRIM